MKDLFNWEKVSWPKRIAIAIPFAAALFGWQYWTKTRELEANHVEMVGLCGSDQECIAAVNQYADACFDENYHMGRHNQGVKTTEFVSCVNRHAGKELFVTVPRQ